MADKCWGNRFSICGRIAVGFSSTTTSRVDPRRVKDELQNVKLEVNGISGRRISWPRGQKELQKTLEV
jgi:hypothetical protein